MRFSTRVRRIENRLTPQDPDIRPFVEVLADKDSVRAVQAWWDAGGKGPRPEVVPARDKDGLMIRTDGSGPVSKEDEAGALLIMSEYTDAELLALDNVIVDGLPAVGDVTDNPELTER
jgi:hypothetical protein